MEQKQLRKSMSKLSIRTAVTKQQNKNEYQNKKREEKEQRKICFDFRNNHHCSLLTNSIEIMVLNEFS